ncbi:MAG TPA: hypothetical protein VHW72_19880, partial [Candidatus Angelobacter sp.]|nr:hypothetical protein [Candidatus Angelobacter sp.]
MASQINTAAPTPVESNGDDLQPAQRTIFNVGDDPELATKDGASLSKKLRQEYIHVPIPEMKDSDAILSHAANPFVVMIHGTTLRDKGALAFQEMLIAKGYPRSKELDLVLITCGGDMVLGEDAQMLANVLQSTVRAAKGKVTVREDGTPIVTVPNEGKPQVYKDDIFGFFAHFAEGWNSYTPQPEATLKVIKRDALQQKLQIKSMQGCLADLMAARQKAVAPEGVERLNRRVELLRLAADKNYTKATELKGKATNKGLLVNRRALEDQQASIKNARLEIDQMEKAWEARNGQSVAEYLRELRRPKLSEVAASATDEVGSGWGDLDIPLDIPLADAQAAPGRQEASASATAEGPTPEKLPASLKVRPGTAVAQRKIIDEAGPTASGKHLSEIIAGFS